MWFGQIVRRTAGLRISFGLAGECLAYLSEYGNGSLEVASFNESLTRIVG